MAGRPKGLPKTGGRAEGTQNKITTTVKQSVLDCYIELQNDPNYNIVAWAKTNMTEFMKIAAKLIPTEVSGPNGESLFKAFNGLDTDKV